MNKQNGFVAFIVILVTAAMICVGISISALILGRYKISENAVKANRAYYAAESGIEDALLKLKDNVESGSFNFALPVDGVTAEVSVSQDVVSGIWIIDSETQNSQQNKKIETVYQIDPSRSAFNYGCQIGEGGLEMGNTSRIVGNVFSNGNILGSGTIDDTAIVAGNSHRIEGPTVGGNVLAYSCKNTNITGTLTYVSGGTVQNCPAASQSVQPGEIMPEAMPIPESQIDTWKDIATQGEIFEGNYSLSNNQNSSLGPVKITGNLTLGVGSHLKMTGTIYVAGNIALNNNSIIELDDEIYGPFSGVIVADGTINAGNGSTARGSGSAGSYILITSMSNSLSEDTPAIKVANNANGALFYAPKGMIYLLNNMKAKEVTAYKVKINNGAEITYENGIANNAFFSGPGGEWRVSSWTEIK